MVQYECCEALGWAAVAQRGGLRLHLYLSRPYVQVITTTTLDDYNTALIGNSTTTDSNVPPSNAEPTLAR